MADMSLDAIKSRLAALRNEPPPAPKKRKKPADDASESDGDIDFVGADEPVSITGVN
jgi:hypothetical protein